MRFYTVSYTIIRTFSSIKRFFTYYYSQRTLIWALSVRTMQSRYIGTAAGLIWAVVSPLMMIFVYWFVFSFGLRVKPTGNIPFVVLFMCGMIPWILFSETLMNNANAVTSNSNLIKKTVFPVEILPLVNLLVGWMTHSIMLLILVILIAVNHIALSISIFSFLYYLFALSMFCLGLGWLFAAINVFSRDTTQMLGVIVNLWFWVTPIAWFSDIMPKQWQNVLKLNPLYYVIEGYKASFIFHAPWHTLKLDVYFWTICLAVFFTGAIIFKKLKPEFADAL